MNRRHFFSFSAAAGLSLSAAGQEPSRMRRADSFFGLHFDLHPNEKDTVLGRDVTEEMVEAILAEAKPDYVQYDAKGHPGWLGWPSEVGPSAPGIVKDSLAVWRKVTARRGVALYIHFSGVWDGEAVKRHPEWARGRNDGKTEDRNTSTFSPYVDEWMIRQLREAATKYQLDGVWVDGDCWATNPDFSAAAVAAWKRHSGQEGVPQNSKDARWLEFLEFNREQFRRYVRRYADALHESHPKFQVASNWLYSTYVPERPELPVDFLSGDYLGNAAISRARLEARYLEATGKPWDLMAWGFQQRDSNAVGPILKPAAQLQQEAGVVLSRGGGFQVYYHPVRSGHFEPTNIAVMGKVARFCRARQVWSHKTESASTAAVLFSRESLYASSNKLFGGWGKLADPAAGWLEALLDNQVSADVLPDWKIGEARYGLLVVPEWTAMSSATRDRLLEEARRGTRLIVSGAANAALFGAAAGVEAGPAREQQTYLSGGEVLGNARGLWAEVTGGEVTGVAVLERRYPTEDSRGNGTAAAVSTKLGEGELVLIPGPIGSIYMATHAAAIRQFVGRVAGPRDAAPVRVEASPVVEVSLRRKQGRLLVHLLNTAGMQVAGDHATVDFVPDAGPVTLRLSQAPRTARLEPEGRALEVKGNTIVVERWGIHAVVVVG